MAANVIYIGEKKRKKKKREKIEKKERNWVANRFSNRLQKIMPQVCSMERDILTYTGYVVVRGGWGDSFSSIEMRFIILQTPWIDESVNICLYGLWSDNTEQSRFVDLKMETWGSLKTNIPMRRTRCKEYLPSKETYKSIRLNYEYNILAN